MVRALTPPLQAQHRLVLVILQRIKHSLAAGVIAFGACNEFCRPGVEDLILDGHEGQLRGIGRPTSSTLADLSLSHGGR